MTDDKLKTLSEGAVLLALATILNLIVLFRLPNGGSISISMLPILLFSIRRGWKPGLLCGLGYGIIQLIFDGAYAWSWVSIVIDYLVAYPLLGLSGVFAGKKNGIYWGSLFGCVLRFLANFISGVTVWKINAPTELFHTTIANPYLYSFLYNGSYIGLSLVLILILFSCLRKPLRPFIDGTDIQR